MKETRITLWSVIWKTTVIILSMFLMLILAVNLADKIGGKIMSKMKSDDIKRIANDLAKSIQKSGGPPTKLELQQFLANQEKSGTIDNASAYHLSYIQPKGENWFLVLVDYYETKAGIFHVSVNEKADGKMRVADKEVYVTSRDGPDGSLDLPSEPEPYKFSDKKSSPPVQFSQSTSSSPTSTGTPSTPSASTRPSLNTSSSAATKGKDVPYNPQGVELYFAVVQNKKVIGRFATLEEAVSLAKKYAHVTVDNGRVLVWDNIKCKILSEKNKELGSFNTIKEGIDFINANKLINTKIIDIQTNRVVYDNFPKECGGCDSPIQNEY